MHAAGPVNTLYFPAAHAEHVPPFLPVDPALQVHIASDPLPAGELEFDGQALHVELPAYPPVYLPSVQSEQGAFPVNSLYFPTAQTAHGPPSGPVHPALQVQFFKAPLPAGELHLSGQPMHDWAPTAVLEYVSAGQFMQLVFPVTPLYLPPTHAAHGSPFGPVYPALQKQLVKAALP